MEALIAPKVTAKNVTIIPRTVDNLKLTPIKSLAKKRDGFNRMINDALAGKMLQ